MKLKLSFTLIILASLFSLHSEAQTIERIYEGHWASTNWKFEFKANGAYERRSMGHYGQTTVNGKYYINNDTIILKSGYENTHGTVNKKYLMEGDSIIIDLNLRYDYKVIDTAATTDGSKRVYLPWSNYVSVIRKVKYPQVNTDNQVLKNELERVLNIAFNSPEIRNYYHFDNLSDRRLIITDYYKLEANITVDSMQAVFIPKEEIGNPFYIEILDINQNEDEIEVQLEIHGEGAEIWFYFKKVNGEWVYSDPSIFER